MDRRDLLKRFGIGAIIAPVIGGVAVREATAALIEVPKIKPVELFTKIPEPIDLESVKRATVQLEMFDGSVRVVEVQHVCSDSYAPSPTALIFGGKAGRVIGPADDFLVKIRFAERSKSSPEILFTLGEIYGEGKLA